MALSKIPAQHRDRAGGQGSAGRVRLCRQADRACLEILAAFGVKLLALRCAGYNNVDGAAARGTTANVLQLEVGEASHSWLEGTLLI